MGTFDLLFAGRKAAPTLLDETARADAALRRCQELRAENAKLKHNCKSLREELETLRRCLAGGR